MSSTEKVLKAKIQAIDNFTKPMQKVISQTKAFQATAKAVKPLVLKAKDVASKVISKVKAQVDKFKATKFGQFVLKAKDMASKVLTKVNGMLRSFASKAWSATVSVKDKASSMLSSIQGKLSALAVGATITVGAKTGFNELANEQTEKLTINRVIKNSGKSKEEAKKSTDEFYKYLEIAKKTLSGTIGNNLLELEFNPEEENPGGRQNFLLGLRDSKLKNDALADRLFELIIENYDYDGNYLILLYHDAYDVIVKTNDNNKLDESEEVYDYLICSICPVELTKAALGYREDEHRIGPRIRDWVVSMPENGFVFPAFTDRSSDIHSLMFYTKTPKEPHTDFAEKTFGCKIKRTAAEEKTAFSSIIKNIAAEDDSDDIVIGIHQALSEIAAEQDTSLSTEPVLLDSRTIENMRTNGFLSQEIADKIEKACEEEFGEEPPVIDNIVDTKVLENYAKKQREAELQKEVIELKSKLEAAESKASDDSLPWDLEDTTPAC